MKYMFNNYEDTDEQIQNTDARIGNQVNISITDNFIDVAIEVGCRWLDHILHFSIL